MAIAGSYESRLRTHYGFFSFAFSFRSGICVRCGTLCALAANLEVLGMILLAFLIGIVGSGL